MGDNPHQQGASKNRFSKLIANAVILVFLYCNTMTFCQATSIQTPLPGINWELASWFNIFGVFGSWEPANRAYVLYGLAKKYESLPRSPTDEMVNLRLYSRFPLWRGEAHRRVHTYLSHDRIWGIVAKVAELEREESGREFQQFVFYQHTWPQSTDGFWSRFSEGGGEILGSKET